MAEKKSKEKENDIKATEEEKAQVEESVVEPKEEIKEEIKEEKVATKKKPSKKEKKDAIKALETKVDEISDKHLRLQAEFDNFRRRTLKEKSELIKSAGESVLSKLLPVIDDFDRAVDSLKEVDAEDPSKKGLELIYTKFQDFLKQNGVTEIEALNQEFDCDHHEAITKIPAPNEELKGKNVDVVQKGYMLGDKVMRFSKVVIGE